MKVPHVHQMPDGTHLRIDFIHRLDVQQWRQGGWLLHVVLCNLANNVVAVYHFPNEESLNRSVNDIFKAGRRLAEVYAQFSIPEDLFDGQQ